MKPNFALSLSFEGIRLLHRSAGGWRVVGDVALDTPDLGAALAALRKSASELEPGGVRCKLIIPNSQIRYLTVETIGLSRAARAKAAEVALENATPYAVADLAYDISQDGPKTHVAAVARETLAEAEAFAEEHRFHPVSFVAIPGEEAYLGEPYFGPTTVASDLLDDGEEIEPDGVAVVVIGDIDPDIAAAPVVAPEEPKALPEDEDATDPDPVIEDQPPDPAPVFGSKRKGTDAPKDDTTDAAPAAPSITSAGFASRRSEPPVKPRADLPQEPSLTSPALVASPAPATPTAPVAPDSSSLTAQPAPAPAGLKTGFLSRRRPRLGTKPKKPLVVEGPKVAPPVDEADRMTVFGARQGAGIGGKPRFLGLMMTVVLLVFLAGVAAWASVFLDDGLARFFGGDDRAIANAPDTGDVTVTEPAPAEPAIETASLDTGLSDEDGAVLDALREPVVTPVPELTEAELEAKYAVTGIWPLAPQVPPTPAPFGLEDLYLTRIDPVDSANDAVALPPRATLDTDREFAALVSPAAPGTTFDLDARGLVVPTAAGALSPDGYTVFAGRPPLTPPATPTRFAAEPDIDTAREGLAGLRPRARPEDLAEQAERARLDGFTRDELAAFRPKLRPRSVQQIAQEATRDEQAEAAAQRAAEALTNAPEAPAEVQPETPAQNTAFENPTRFAAAQSRRPDTRPRNFSRIVKRAQRRAAQQRQTAPEAQTASVAPRAVQPKIPSKTSVAKQATVRNAINLRKVNLIGVYGKPSSRRALVRLANGRYRKVVVGDRLDGGRISAIGDSELRYTKRGRNVVLKMPRS